MTMFHAHRKTFRVVVDIAMFAALLIPIFPAAVHAATQATYWVATPGDPSTPGNDSNVGTDSQHPFATLDHARSIVNGVLHNGPLTGDIVVNINPGTYYTPNTVNFDQTDSGTGGYRVIYQNAPTTAVGSAKFVGGTAVSSTWTLVTSSSGADADLPVSADGHVYKTNVGTGVDFNTLYVDDARAVMARTPNLNIDPRFPSALGGYAWTTGGGMTSFTYNPADLPAGSPAVMGLTNQTTLDAQVVVWSWQSGGKDWMTDTIPIGSINTSTNTIMFRAVTGHPELNRPHYPVGGGSRYFLQGNLGFLDAPGEYYFNKTTGDLYYYPLNGANPNNENIVIPTTEKIINIAGASRTSLASNITFNGLEFEDTNFPDYYTYAWNFNDSNGGIGTYPPQAAGSTLPSYSNSTERVEFQVGNVTLTNTHSIKIINSHIKNAGLFGVELYLANDQADIENTLIEYTGHGGVNIEGGYPGTGGDSSGNGYSNNTTVTDCLIHDIGQLVGQTSGVSINNATANTVSNSEIYNSPRRALLIIGGYPYNPSGTPPNDANYNRMTDLYAHDNHFTENYLHDAQQDGGDDGAFFGMLLYRGSTNYRPNYINQMLIDKVGANPSMTDLAPNDMNLDTGDAGFQVSNFKAVNPQNFNAEVGTVTGYGDYITFTNTNIDFGSQTNQLSEFDDSKIDYPGSPAAAADGNAIGLTNSFPSGYRPVVNTPAPPSNIYFQDAFESGLDLTKWIYRGQLPVTSTEFMSEGVLAGKRSLEIASDSAPAGAKPVLARNFGQPLNKIVTVELFDRQNGNLASYESGVTNSATVKSIARVDDGQHVVGLGLDTTFSANYFVLQDGATETATYVPRSYGWHQLMWDYTSGTNVKLYIDGTLVDTTSSLPSFSQLQLGSDDGVGVSFYDQVYVYGGTGTGTAPALPAPPPNLTDTATITASSEDGSVYSVRNVADNIAHANGRGEWASNGELTPWITLTWPTSQTMNTVVLADRANLIDWVKGGILTFSDGSTVAVPALPNDGSPNVIRFPDKAVTSVTFKVTSAVGYAAGLSEFYVFEVPNLAPSATPTVSSQYTSQYGPQNLIDGIIGQTGTGEWSALSTDTHASATLTWSTPQSLAAVVLYDRANYIDQVTGGTLTFSDGSTVPVPALHNDGSRTVITFPERDVTSVTLSINSWTGSPGLSEFEAYSGPVPINPDLAMTASITSSSQYSPQYPASKVADGIIGLWGPGEWAVAASDTAPSVTLTWANPQAVNQIALYDRSNSTDQVTGGTLKFSDGTTISVPALPNDGSRYLLVFPVKTVTSVEFDITSWTGLPGLSELQVYNQPNLALGTTVTASSQYSAQYPPTNVIDGIIGQNGVGEWAVGATDSSPWVKLTWASPQTFSTVVLYDRANLTDQVTGGTLVFSDGSSVPVPALRNDGSATVITLPATKTNVTSVQLNITSYTGLPGLSEFQVYTQ